jgi:hypothetical protein
MERTMNELSFGAKTLIARARAADGPGPERRARVKRALVASLVGASATIGTASSVAAAGLPVAAAAKVTLTAGTIALWLGMGAALGTIASAPAVVVRLVESEPPPGAVQAPPDPAPAKAVVEPAKVVEAPVEEAPSAPPEDQVARPQAKVAEPIVAPPSLSEETRLLEAAQRELASGRPASALELLDEHAARHPGGALTEERTAARVLSLCALGRTDEARRSARAFLAASPRSPLIPRLRGSCALEGKSDDEIPAR